MAETEARQLAAAEGLSLVPADNSTGYKGVRRINGNGKPFQAQISQDGKQHHLGSFATAAEAALAYARRIGPVGCAAAAATALAAPEPPMTEEEAKRQAAAEGLSLLLADNATGFKCVMHSSHQVKRKGGKPFYAQVTQGGR